MVRDDGQTDFIGALWAPVARMLNPDEVRRDTLAVDELPLPSGRLVVRFVRHLRGEALSPAVPARWHRLMHGSASWNPARGETLRDGK